MVFRPLPLVYVQFLSVPYLPLEGLARFCRPSSATMAMDALNATAQQLADQAQRFSFFTGLVKPAPQYRFFLVAGRQGRERVPLLRAVQGRMLLLGMNCTLVRLPPPLIPLRYLTASCCRHSLNRHIQLRPSPRSRRPTRQIHLITPGFNDTTRSDIDTPGVLASYLGGSYASTELPCFIPSQITG